MGREGHETTVVCSSIAMLQERFRQLERVKEMREERELLRTLSEPNDNDNNHYCNKKINDNNPKPSHAVDFNKHSSSRLFFFHPDLVFPQRSTSVQLSLSLWPTFHGGFDGDRNIPTCSKLWPYLDTSLSAFVARSPNESRDDSEYFYETDVDTSLHL